MSVPRRRTSSFASPPKPYKPALSRLSPQKLQCNTRLSKSTSSLPFGVSPSSATKLKMARSPCHESGASHQALSPTFFGSSHTSEHGSSYKNYQGATTTITASMGIPQHSKSLMVLLFCLIGGITYLSKHRELVSLENILRKVQTDLNDLQQSHSESKSKLFDAYEAVARLERKSEKMGKRNEHLQKELAYNAKQQRQPNDESHVKDLKQSNEVMKRQIKLLEKHIQENSKREAIEKFGPGPHHVRFDVVFMDNLDKLDVKTIRQTTWKERNVNMANFTLELAPLDIMPHSVNLFLNMIDQKLWDDTVFVHSADHVLEASPTVFYSGKSKRPLFSSKGLSNVVFQEYSEQYPHLKYTVGFAGRPGGPDFYISTQDNSKHHAPGGQGHLHVAEGGEPCFGRVVDGYHVVDRMIRRSNEDDGEKRKNDEVLITVIASATIL